MLPSTTTQAAIEKFCFKFPTHGLPELVSRSAFTCADFEDFTRGN